MRPIKESFGVDNPFLSVADLDVKGAETYGMIQPSVLTLRIGIFSTLTL